MFYQVEFVKNGEESSHVVQALDKKGAKEVFANDPVYKGAKVLKVIEQDSKS